MSSPYSSQAHVLVTGGSSGIGLGLARRYLAMGARVLITGRDAAKLKAVVHLNSLLVPGMLDRGQDGMIINVTSGGAYVPQPFAPIYSACKAALHSHTVTLRHALAGTHIRVKELIPPAVATGLAGPGATHGAPLDDFCDAVFPALVHGDANEIGFGMTATEEFGVAMASYRDMFDRFSQRFPIATYASRSEAS